VNVKRFTLDEIDLAEKIVMRFKGHIEHLSALKEFLSRPNNILIGAYDDNQTVGIGIGYVLDRTETGSPMFYIHDIEVAAHVRRQGVGCKIIDVFIRLARKAGALKMFVITDRDNVAAMALYESAGAKAMLTDDLVYEWRGLAD